MPVDRLADGTTYYDPYNKWLSTLDYKIGTVWCVVQGVDPAFDPDIYMEWPAEDSYGKEYEGGSYLKTQARVVKGLKKNQFKEEVVKIIAGAELHEVYEWFEDNGIKVYDPHKVKFPKRVKPKRWWKKK